MLKLRDRGEGQELGSRYSHDLYVERLYLPDVDKEEPESLKGNGKCQKGLVGVGGVDHKSEIAVKDK